MKLHQLPKTKKRVQRIGRSGKRGSYSGRGVKGQKSRSGRRLRPAERDLILRFPKQRGFANAPKSEVILVLNLSELSTALKNLAAGKAPFELNHDVLRATGLIRKSHDGVVKILGTGEIAFPMNVKGLKASASAKAKIKKAGGSVS